MYVYMYIFIYITIYSFICIYINIYQLFTTTLRSHNHHVNNLPYANKVSLNELNFFRPREYLICH